MKLTRRGKTIRNLVLVLLLAGLLTAQWEFTPLTAAGLCRRFGRDNLTTPPEPVYTATASSLRFRRQALVIGRIGTAWAGWLSVRDGLFSGWEPTRLVTPQLSEGPILIPFDNSLYLAGDFPPETAAVTCTVTVTHTRIQIRADGSRGDPELGEERVLTLDGEPVAEGVLRLPYEHRVVFDPEDAEHLGELARCWYQLRQDGERGWGTLHTHIPVKMELRDASGAVLNRLHFEVLNYDLLGV